MGKVFIESETTHNPITAIGKYAGICWGTDTSNLIKNYKRGLECLSNNHGRTLEFPQIYIVLEDYSARVIRELYTHIGGMPTRLQESTRYINEENFDYVIPKSIENNPSALETYKDVMDTISTGYHCLLDLGISKEDSANLLPLGMHSKVVFRTNLRHLIEMSQTRLCTRAYWEFRELIKDIMTELSKYDEEYALIIEKYFKPICEIRGYCIEKYSCGKMPMKNNL